MKDIEQILRDNAPEIPDEGQFMIETAARLKAVEGIKSEVDHSHRRGRIAMIIALASGIALGSIAVLLILNPVDVSTLLPEDSAAGIPFVDKMLAAARSNVKGIAIILVAATALALGLTTLTRRQEEGV